MLGHAASVAHGRPTRECRSAAAWGPSGGPAATIDFPMPIASNDFVHLHTHSEFSLLDGLGRITELVDEASTKGFDSLAIPDPGALYGAVAFSQAATNKGIKPIIGV